MPSESMFNVRAFLHSNNCRRNKHVRDDFIANLNNGTVVQKTEVEEIVISTYIRIH